LRTGTDAARGRIARRVAIWRRRAARSTQVNGVPQSPDVIGQDGVIIAGTFGTDDKQSAAE
jgi:hypothetical protein